MFRGSPGASYTATNNLGTISINSVLLDVANATAAGITEVSGGTFRFFSDGAELPSITFKTSEQSVRINANLQLEADLTIWRQSPSFNGLGINSSSEGGNIDLGSHTLTISRAPSLESQLNGLVTIGGSLSSTYGVISGTGKVVLDDQDLRSGTQVSTSLASRNTYSGGTEVYRGQLLVQVDTIVNLNGSFSGPFGPGPVTMYGGVLRATGFLTPRYLYNPLEVKGDFTLAGLNPGVLFLKGPVTLHGSHTVSVARPSNYNENAQTQVLAPISEAQPGSGITWDLQADVILDSACSYTGPTIVQGGTLRIFGSGNLGQSPLTLRNGGLSGTGLTGDVHAESGSIVSPGITLGLLRSNGSAQLDPGAQLWLELNAPVSAKYDQWQISGSVSVEGADLRIGLNTGVFVPGEIYYLILNGGTDAIEGTFGSFNGLPADLEEGSRFLVSGQEFELSYTAESGIGFSGAGNDLAIRAVPEPGTAAVFLAGFIGLATWCRRRSPPAIDATSQDRS